jgi:hypothetical protein
MNLFGANKQWATRPPDERFSSLAEMLAACLGYYESACEASAPFDTLKAKAVEEEVRVTGSEHLEADLTFWAFGQLARLASAPAAYMRELPAALAAECVNFGLQRRTSSAPIELLFHKKANEDGHLKLPGATAIAPSPLVLRALTSKKYTRIWNWEVVERLIRLQEQGWRVPPARPACEGQPGARTATDEDVLDAKGSLSINVGDLIAPAGLYASAHDMFAFLINEKSRLDDGTEQGLSRGIFFENGEVGDKALRSTTFLYRHVCGNHIVWDASNIIKLHIRHVGKARQKFSDFVLDLKKYANSAVSLDERKIKKAQTRRIAATKREVLDRLFKLLHQSISLEQLDAAFDLAGDHTRIDGDPLTYWGMAQGISRLSQQTSFLDERTRLDRCAGKVLKIVF